MPNIPSPEWSPLLIVDFSEEDGWRNVAKGDYVAYAHIHRHDCVLVCDEMGPSPFECKLCAHTVVNFTLPSDRASLSWRIAVVLLSLCGITYVFILRRKVRRTPIQVQEIELQSKPSVLLLTPDDCDEHSGVVLVLSRILEQHAGVTVMLDYHEMSNSVPSEFGRLIALIHSIDVHEFNPAADSTLLDEFGATVEAMMKMVQEDPNWIERRLLTDVCFNTVY
ncbi:hypothetical protein ANCDUO_08131 [Ancylostoma duodenale]|uniref:Uncharacterized protein n=1 Tax=Ancylostoma duodenale TaxID=51022 RepID=A0A0C2GR57_9BILA|nr:hypothetical protein ANCDUO_08131 [Ancylostoma duodenale]